MGRLLLLFFFVVTVVVVVVAKKRKSSSSKAKEEVTITKADFCEGCIETVNVYAARLVKGLEKYESNSIVQGTVFAAESVIDNICDDSHFDVLNPSIKYSCVKIINDNSTSFMQKFEGKLDRNFNQVKNLMFELKKKVCYDDVNACDLYRFQMPEKGQRNRCTACHIISNDIDIAVKKNMNNKKNKIKLEEIIDNVCDSLGFNHSPYSWLEDYCEEMIENNYSTIIDATSFRKKLYASHFNPDNSFSDSLCDELYKCQKEGKHNTEL